MIFKKNHISCIHEKCHTNIVIEEKLKGDSKDGVKSRKRFFPGVPSCRDCFVDLCNVCSVYGRVYVGAFIFFVHFYCASALWLSAPLISTSTSQRLQKLGPLLGGGPFSRALFKLLCGVSNRQDGVS